VACLNKWVMGELALDRVEHHRSLARRQLRQLVDRGVGEPDLVRHHAWLSQKPVPYDRGERLLRANAFAITRRPRMFRNEQCR